MTAATGLYNVVRQVGGSIGIALHNFSYQDICQAGHILWKTCQPTEASLQSGFQE